MSSNASFPSVTQDQLFARLAAGLQAGATVVTPNRRLALALKQAFDGMQAQQGLAAWEAADILPLPAFVERAYEDALYSARSADLPLLLAPAQEQALWETIIRSAAGGDALLALPEAARLAREAWQLMHAWRLSPQPGKFPLNEDGAAFAEWARQYERACKRDGHTDAARLCDLVATLFSRARMRVPKLLLCYGFDVITPQQAALLQALAAAGCQVARCAAPLLPASAARIACRDGEDEIRHAAAWARSQLEAGRANIGVVVPDLAPRRAAIVRVFSATMAADYALPDAAQHTLPFNVSLGVALTAYPLVHAALLVLELAGREIGFEHASQLIRSPFLAAGEIEMAQRAQLDADLRRRAEPVLTLERLLALVADANSTAGSATLARILAALAEFRKSQLFGTHAPSAWAKRISEALAVVGFPGERGLDSAEYQALMKWHETVAAYAALDRVAPRSGYPEAVSRLRRMAADTLFQPETPQVPIQILGVLEAAGMRFDSLWVMGLSDETWPPAPRPNPFLPVELQRAAALPHSSAVAALAQARRLTDEWLGAAREVVLSHPRRDNDRELKPSPLIAAVTAMLPAPPAYPVFRDAIHAARALERSEDCRAPPLDRAAVLHAGAAMIKNQAACPFRAFALHRVGAEGLQAPHTGLDALERGTLVHRVLAQAWTRLKTRDALEAMDSAGLDALLARAAEDAVARIQRKRPAALSGRFAEIEKRRLTRLARAWLDEDRKRDSFTVVAIEDKRAVAIGRLAFNARLDRVDELPDGRRIVIDYKTSAPAAAAMLGERPDEPQLPLYLVSTEPGAAAVAFAQVRAGDMKFSALARDADLLPDVKAFVDSTYRDHHASWQDLVEAWRADLGRLAAAFAVGEAQVDPKQHPLTCRNCDVKPFCRIHERLENTLVDGEGAE
jgi:probable DNA repair protein